MTLRYLLDTSVISEPVTKRPAQAIIDRLDKLGSQCAIAAPVWHELQYGCEKLPTGIRRDALRDYLANVVNTSFPILPYDDAAALRHAMERARLERAGKTAPFVDGQIASIALIHNLALVTRNVRDFVSFAGLRVEDWVTRQV